MAKFLCMMILVLSAFVPASKLLAGTRVALVIGNADYGNFGRLQTPIRDAQLMAETLSGLGFQVKRKSNLERRELKSELTAFLRVAKLADVALIYYSGYQLTLNDKTHLTPVGEAPRTVNAAQLGMVSVEALMRRLSDAATQNILILEGGWRSPIVTNLGGFLEKGSVETLRSSPSDLSGLAVLDGDRIVTITASSDGRLTPEEQGEVSVFTRELVNKISVPGLRIEEAFKQVHEAAAVATGRLPSPAVSGKFSSALYLAGQPLIVPERSEESILAQKRWRDIRSSNISEEVQEFLDEYGDTPLAGVALNKLQSLKAIDPEERRRLKEATIERRALLKAYNVEKERKTKLLKELRAGRVAINPILAPFEVKGNAAVRAEPGSSGSWLGHYKDGDVAQVRGKVIGKNWLQVEWSKDEAGAPIYGYMFSKSAAPRGASDYVVWLAISENPTIESLQVYLNNFPDGFYRFEAVNSILKQKYPDALAVKASGKEEGSEGDVDIGGLQLLATEVPKLNIANSNPSATQTISEPNSGPKTIMIREMGYKLDVFEQEFITTSKANLRRLPWIKTRIKAVADRDSKIVVTGKVQRKDWYRVKWGEGRDLYVHGSTVEPFAGSEFELWQESKSSGEITDLNFYLQYYSTGRFSNEAKAMITKIRSQQNVEDQVILTPSAGLRVDLPSGADEFVNVRPIVYGGAIHKTLSASLMHKFGNTLKTRVSNQRQSQPNTLLDISGRVIAVEIEDAQRTSFLGLSRFLGEVEEEEPTENDALLSYNVTVELIARIKGETDPIFSIAEQHSDIGPETAQPLAIQITMKKAFDQAADEILIKLGSSFN